MGKVVTDTANYTAIANAINDKTNQNKTYTPAEMAPAIQAISTSTVMENLTFTGGATGVYNGTKPLTINIPTGSGGSGDMTKAEYGGSKAGIVKKADDALALGGIKASDWSKSVIVNEIPGLPEVNWSALFNGESYHESKRSSSNKSVLNNYTYFSAQDKKIQFLISEKTGAEGVGGSSKTRVIRFETSQALRREVDYDPFGEQVDGKNELILKAQTDTSVVSIQLIETFNVYGDYFVQTATIDVILNAGLPTSGAEGDILRIVGGKPTWQSTINAATEAM